MPINRIIREKRKEAGLTQEQIAEYLGVSAPAVNKWEKGATYPDISLLAPLARLLKVDLNTLLCFHEGLTEQEVNLFTKELADTLRKGSFDDGFARAIDKVREYPNCGLLIHRTAMVLDGGLMMSGMNDVREKYEHQIMDLYERAAQSGDDKIRMESIFMLASKHMGVKEYNKAQELLDLLPEQSALDKRQLQAALFMKQNKLEEAAEILTRKLLSGVNEIQNALMGLVDIELAGDSGENASYIAELSRKIAGLFDLWEYGSFVAPLQVAVAQKDVPGSILLLKSMLSAVVTPRQVEKSPLYSHIDVKEWGTVGARMLPALLSAFENNPEYAFLHSNAEFQQLMKQYRTKC